MTFLKLDLDDQDIGKWVQRETVKGRVLTKPHYVESVIDGDPVTHCGRRLRRGTGYPFREVTGESACLNCAEMASGGPTTWTVLSLTNESVTA